MSVTLRASISVPVPIERAWEVWTDAARYPHWQGGVIAVTDLTGPVGEVGTTYTLDHGPKLKRQVRVVASERPVRHVIEQTGVGMHDQTVATFGPDGDGTLVTLVVYAHMNAVLRFFQRLDVRGWSQREFQRELDRFAAIAARRPGPARVGGVYLATAAATRRRLTVIAVDRERIHIRLHPGHLRADDPANLVPASPKPLSDQMDLRSIQPPLRAPLDISNRGLPFLVRDGGHGVAHLALSQDAWADADPRDIATEEVSEHDLAAIEQWRRFGGPTVGADADLALAPVCTLRFGVDDEGAEVWGVAKVLRSEILRVHLAIPGDRWAERPARIDAGRYGSIPAPSGVEPDPTASPGDRVEIGHVPVDRAAFGKGAPQFAGIATVTSGELEGYRMWRDAKGGTFDTLQVFALPPTLESMREAAERAPDDPYDLDRFVEAQDVAVFESVLRELRTGRKTGHWMWFIFPQIAGLGRSEMSRMFAIRSLDEARSYLAHPVLGPRLRECSELVLAVEGRTAVEIFGLVDAKKLRSSMTLFQRAVPDDPMFARVIDRYFDGVPDAATDALLASRRA